MLVLYFFVCFLSSIVGAICGIGGGVIIKPVLDATNTLDAVTISFLSGCTVLAMTSYSVIRAKMTKKKEISMKSSFPLAVGAAVGGVLGKQIFSLLIDHVNNASKVGLVQAICLLMITVITFIYTIFKEKIRTKQVAHAAAGIIIGALLGIMSAFLGIGGGPINIIVLYYFYSLDTKAAAQNSLFVIFFSQLLSLVVSIAGHSVPKIDPMLLGIMVIAGIGGGMFGRWLNARINEKMVSKLFLLAMVVIIVINVHNIYLFA